MTFDEYNKFLRAIVQCMYINSCGPRDYMINDVLEKAIMGREAYC